MYLVILYSVDGSKVRSTYYSSVGSIVITDLDGVSDCVGKVKHLVVRVNRQGRYRYQAFVHNYCCIITIKWSSSDATIWVFIRKEHISGWEKNDYIIKTYSKYIYFKTIWNTLFHFPTSSCYLSCYCYNGLCKRTH